MSELFCGIDFGTSNSSIAVSSCQISPQIVEVEEGKQVIPSAIFYEQGKTSPLFGTQALKAYMQGQEGRFMRSLKRVLGTDLMISGTYLNGKSVKFENILSQYINRLKREAEVKYQQEISSVVLGRPVHFRDNDLQGDKRAETELKQIAKTVGFKNVLFQFEPIAAAFAHEKNLSSENLACVIDIGGGTSDFSIIRLGPQHRAKNNRFEDILGSSGVRIGGNDFDQALSILSFMPEFGLGTTYGSKNLPVPSSIYFDLSEWSRINSVYSYQNHRMIQEVYQEAHCPSKYARLVELVENERGHLLLNKVEESKINLSTQTEDESILEFISTKPKIKTTCLQFEESIKKTICKIEQAVADVLTQAQITAEQISLIVLTGGSTEIPYVRRSLCQQFTNAQISDQNRMASVGLGLAYDALRRFA